MSRAISRDAPSSVVLASMAPRSRVFWCVFHYVWQSSRVAHPGVKRRWGRPSGWTRRSFALCLSLTRGSPIGNPLRQAVAVSLAAGLHTQMPTPSSDQMDGLLLLSVAVTWIGPGAPRIGEIVFSRVEMESERKPKDVSNRGVCSELAESRGSVHLRCVRRAAAFWTPQCPTDGSGGDGRDFAPAPVPVAYRRLRRVAPG